MTHDQLIRELDDLAWRLTRSAALLRYYGGLNADMVRQARDLTQAAGSTSQLASQLRRRHDDPGCRAEDDPQAGDDEKGTRIAGAPGGDPPAQETIMSECTPGPWVARKVTEQEWAIDAPHGDPVIGHDGWNALAVVYGCDDNPIEGRIVAEANARLIAAAPDMLAALEGLIELAEFAMLETGELAEFAMLETGELADARAAVAKALGQ